MPDTSQTTSFTPLPPTVGDLEGAVPSSTPGEFDAFLPPVQKSLLPSAARSLLPSVSPLINAVRQNPLASATAVCAVLIGVTAGVVNLYYNWDWLEGDRIIQGMHNESGIVLIGHGYRVDVANKIMLIEWEVTGCGEYYLPTYPPPSDGYLAAGCGCVNRAVDVYFNSVSTPTFSYNPANFSSVGGQSLAVSADCGFGVSHLIDFYNPDMVPFDVYSVSLIASVIEKATNKSMPIIEFAACEGSDNFVMSSFSELMVSENDTGSGVVETYPGLIEIVARRSRLAQAFTMCLLLINWALALGSTYVTVVVVVRRDKVHEGVLLLPVTIILTIPTLRGLFVGSPPFGIYLDTFGFFLQMIIVVICSMILLYVVSTPPVQVPRASRDKGNIQSPEEEGGR